MKFLYFGDPHIRGTNPRNRKDNYKEGVNCEIQGDFRIS